MINTLPSQDIPCVRRARNALFEATQTVPGFFVLKLRYCEPKELKVHCRSAGNAKPAVLDYP